MGRAPLTLRALALLLRFGRSSLEKPNRWLSFASRTAPYSLKGEKNPRTSQLQFANVAALGMALASGAFGPPG